MKRIIIYLFFTAFASATLFYACSKQVKDKNSNIQNNDDLGIIVGSFFKDGSGVPELGLTFEEAVSLIQENNRLTDENYFYNYTEVWIETLSNANSTDYYLVSRADVTDNLGDTVYSCCSFYFILLEDENNNLIYAEPGNQYNCAGVCCKGCKLESAVPPATEPTCECETPVGVDDCAGKDGYCNQTTSISVGGGTG